MKSKLIALALLAGSSMFAQSRVSVGIQVGGYGQGYYDDAPVYAVQPPCPGPEYNWAAGYWSSNYGRRSWVPGSWVRRHFDRPVYDYRDYRGNSYRGNGYRESERREWRDRHDDRHDDRGHNWNGNRGR
jgi:hypothetical protein